jgi:hypothetical protein
VALKLLVEAVSAAVRLDCTELGVIAALAAVMVPPLRSVGKVGLIVSVDEVRVPKASVVRVVAPEPDATTVFPVAPAVMSEVGIVAL